MAQQQHSAIKKRAPGFTHVSSVCLIENLRHWSSAVPSSTLLHPSQRDDVIWVDVHCNALAPSNRFLFNHGQVQALLFTEILCCGRSQTFSTCGRKIFLFFGSNSSS